MAKTLKHADGTPFDPKRDHTYYIPPDEFIVVPADNTRWRPASDAHVRSIALSMLAVGQLQPVIARLVPPRGGRPKIEVGYNRHAAAVLITRERMGTGPWPFLLRTEVRNTNDLDSMIASIEENEKRAAVGPMDRAYAILRLARDHRKTHGEIAVIYGRPMSTPEEVASAQHWVERYKRLTLLPNRVQVLIADRVLSMKAAMPLFDVPEERMEEVLTALLNGTGRAQEREQEREQEQDATPEVTATRQLTTATTAPIATVATSAPVSAPVTVTAPAVRDVVRRMGVLKSGRGRSISEYKDCQKGMGGVLAPPISAHLRWDVMGSRERLKILCSAELQWLAGTLSDEEYVRVKERATAANGGGA